MMLQWLGGRPITAGKWAVRTAVPESASFQTLLLVGGIVLVFFLIFFLWLWVSDNEPGSGGRPGGSGGTRQITNAVLLAAMLREAAETFRLVGERDPGLSATMTTAADAAERTAGLLEKKKRPQGVTASGVAHLMRETARVYRVAGNRMPERKTELYKEANELEDVALTVEHDPLG